MISEVRIQVIGAPITMLNGIDKIARRSRRARSVIAAIEPPVAMICERIERNRFIFVLML